MKFYCTSSWVHSGHQSFSADEVYDLTKDQVRTFAAMKNPHRKDDEIGAMKRFSPMDAEAKAIMAELMKEAATPPKAEERGPTRPELMKEAASLGLEVKNTMKVSELIEMIAAKKAELSAAGA